MLKALFNLMTQRAGFGEEDTEEEAVWLRFTAVIHDLLVARTSTTKQDAIRRYE